MGEPVLRLKPMNQRLNILMHAAAIIIVGVVWYVTGVVMPMQRNVPVWVFALINLFYALIMVYAIWTLISQVRLSRSYRFVKDFALYRDYAWLLTVDGEEVIIPISSFNPCVISYEPPTTTYYPVFTHNPGSAVLAVTYYGISYAMAFNIDQCKQLNQVLVTGFGKQGIDWCREEVKKVGPIRLTRRKLAC